MAVRRTNARKTRSSPRRKTAIKTGRASASTIFLLFLIVVLVTTFFTLLPKVKKNLSQTSTITEQVEPQEPSDLSERNVQPEKSPAPNPAKPTEKTPEKPAAEKPPEKSPAAPPVRETPTAPAAKPVEQPSSQPKPQQSANQQPPASPPPAAKPVETRDRTVYFMQDGADLLLIRTSRKIAVSDSPLIDTINALLIGPNAEESRRGLTSFVPPGTRLLSARVSGNTVFLNFNEEFRYNTFGREGCEAQLKQIVWTATEFPNVNNVQILIAGNTVDFLTEGVVIRNPIGR